MPDELWDLALRLIADGQIQGGLVVLALVALVRMFPGFSVQARRIRALAGGEQPAHEFPTPLAKAMIAAHREEIAARQQEIAKLQKRLARLLDDPTDDHLERLDVLLDEWERAS